MCSCSTVRHLPAFSYSGRTGSEKERGGKCSREADESEIVTYILLLGRRQSVVLLEVSRVCPHDKSTVNNGRSAHKGYLKCSLGLTENTSITNQFTETAFKCSSRTSQKTKNPHIKSNSVSSF